jgi:hypothetical protein
MKRFEHLGNPDHAFLDQVDYGVDKPANASGGSQKWTPVGVLAGLFLPIVLSCAQFGAMIIYRYCHRQPVICFASKMMIVFRLLAFALPLARIANSWIALWDQRFRPCFSAYGASLVLADTPRSLHFAPVRTAGITPW